MSAGRESNLMVLDQQLSPLGYTQLPELPAILHRTPLSHYLSPHLHYSCEPRSTPVRFFYPHLSSQLIEFSEGIFSTYYNTQNITGIPHNHIGQTVVNRSNCTFKKMNKYKCLAKPLRDRLCSALLPLNYLQG